MSERSLSLPGVRRLMRGWRDSSSAPAYRQIADRLRFGILDGRIGLSVRLPGERRLAEELGVARITVSQAYDLLRADGFLESGQGRGSVTVLPDGAEALQEGASNDPGLMDLAAATTRAHPDLAPAYRKAMEHLPALLPHSGYEMRGEIGLRTVLADRYAEVGVAVSPDQLMICQGAQHGLVLLIRAFLKPGDQVAVDLPSYPNALEAFHQAGVQMRGYPVTESGWSVAELERDLAQGRYKMAYLIADHHNPTGQVMDAEARFRLARAAKRGGALIVFDECVRELWRDAPPPLIDPPHYRAPIVRLGSASKVFWGGLRTGWIAADRRIIDQVHATRSSIDLGGPPLEQITTRVLFEDFPEAVARQRAQLRDEHAFLSAEIAQRFPDWISLEVAGGMSLWLRLPRAVSAALAGAARDLGLKLEPGPRFFLHKGGEQNLRLPFSRDPAFMTRALDILEQAWAQTGVSQSLTGQARAESPVF
ncbi:PLP-dependent aminotransferase family protein [Oceanicaulis sp. MMSF_3324]|uniref:aminotransferase-like domain-containing protein n=1 Tax=Oceanicaulis sp. MMSF_3324 TaxID=3046702 RepID=UPI00273DF742|nr:PLP-dependent aminotransferase family protein [Oceanicaulis sp. MMSF_3324]